MIFIKRFVKNAILKTGYEIKRVVPHKTFGFSLQRLLSDHQVNTVLDVGANVGGYAMFLRKLGYRGKIISFEPLSVAYDQLVENAKNDSEWNVAPKMAIGNFDGEIVINISNNLVSSSILEMLPLHKKNAPDSAYCSSERVAIHRLDTVAFPYLNHNRVFLKADVQGYEKRVLEGAEKIFDQITGIQLELSFAPLYEGQELFLEMVNFLDRYGFSLYSVNPGFTDRDSGRVLQVMGVFFRE